MHSERENSQESTDDGTARGQLTAELAAIAAETNRVKEAITDNDASSGWLPADAYDEDDDDEWIGEQTLEEKESSTKARMESHYVYGNEPNTDSPDYDAYQHWLTDVTPEERAALEPHRQEVQAAMLRNLEAKPRVEAAILQTAPDLFAGHLPTELAERVDQPYALLVNQTSAATQSEADTLLSQKGGIDVAGWNLDQRFIALDPTLAAADPEQTRDMVAGGYFRNYQLGKFIVAAPLADVQPDEMDHLKDLAMEPATQRLPADFYTGESVSAKYVAGFIDEAGLFRSNPGFMVDSRADVSPNGSGEWL